MSTSGNYSFRLAGLLCGVTLFFALLCLLAGGGLALFLAVVGYFTGEWVNLSTGQLRFMALAALVAMPGLWLCRGYYRLATQAVTSHYARKVWLGSAVYHLAAMGLMRMLMSGSVQINGGVDLPAIPFWLVSLVAAVVSLWSAMRSRAERPAAVA